MPIKHIINQGKGLLVEIRHKENNTGAMSFFVRPTDDDYPHLTENLKDNLSAEGLKVTHVTIAPRSDYQGRDMAIAEYEGTLNEAKTAAGAYRNLVADPSLLSEITHEEKVALHDRLWVRKDNEWSAAENKALKPSSPAR